MSGPSSDTLDELEDQSLESQFLARLTANLPSVVEFLAAAYSYTMSDFGDDEAQRKAQDDGAGPLAREEAQRLVRETTQRQAEEEFERQVKRLEETKRYNPIKLEFKQKNRLSNESNYDVWAIRMRGLLNEAGLWGHVIGDTSRPQYVRNSSDPTGRQSAQEEWDILDFRAQSFIRSGLSESMILSTSSATNSKEIWDNLELLYKAHDTMTKMQANTFFYSLKMKEDETSPDPRAEKEELTEAAATQTSGHITLRSRKSFPRQAKAAKVAEYVHHPYGPADVGQSPSRMPFEDHILFHNLLKGCKPAEWGMWSDGKVSINEEFSYWGCRWIVKEATYPYMGLGLFSAQRIVVKQVGEQPGVPLFVFGGAEYKQGDWQKIAHKTRFPAIRKYALTANNCWRRELLAEGKPAPPLLFIDGHVHFGNAAGYINSSRGLGPTAANAIWEEKACSHHYMPAKHDLWVCTTASRTIEKGEKIFIDYSWHKEEELQRKSAKVVRVSEEEAAAQLRMLKLQRA